MLFEERWCQRRGGVCPCSVRKARGLTTEKIVVSEVKVGR